MPNLASRPSLTHKDKQRKASIWSMQSEWVKHFFKTFVAFFSVIHEKTLAASVDPIECIHCCTKLDLNLAKISKKPKIFCFLNKMITFETTLDYSFSQIFFCMKILVCYKVSHTEKLMLWGAVLIFFFLESKLLSKILHL